MSSYDREKDYSRVGFGKVLGWGERPAVLIVDLCKAYYTEGSPLDIHAASPEAAAVPEMTLKLIEAARKGGCPVIWTRVVRTAPLSVSGGLFQIKTGGKGLFNEGDPRGLGAWVPGVEPDKEDLIITKQYPSSFFGTTLATSLTVMKIDTLAICGVSTSGCVRATVLDAMQHGFRPMVVKECVGDRSQSIQDANLFDLNAKYSDVVSIENAIEHLEKGWAK